ncbi:MAG: DUF1028 domain-containing protein, partial [Planctomycetota bacterium]
MFEDATIVKGGGRRCCTLGRLVLAVMLAAGAGRPVLATWSIVIVDTRSGEIAVGSATCLTGFDLQAELPVVIPDVGAACAQALVDFNAVNRMQIHQGLLDGLRPEEILSILETGDPFHQSRQYGIADVRGRTLTFSGADTLSFAGGVTGQVGTIVYAIQGNILTGSPVISAAEEAVRNTPGGLPEKLMAGMEAAYAMGGDGRCSCPLLEPTECGSPPPIFDKSAHVGFMIVSRTGDTAGVCTAELGCANGDYYLDIDIAGQQESDPDPVLQMRERFDAWRAGLIGVPDAVQSTVTIDPPELTGDGTGQAVMMITLRDWQDTPVTDGAWSVTVTHAADSAGLATIGPVTDNGGGVFSVMLDGGLGAGVDRFQVTASGPGRPVTLIPLPELVSFAPLDLDRDRDVDADDYAAWRSCLGGPFMPPVSGCEGADGDGDGDADLDDFG